jgi:hypothetical protein
VHRDHFIFKYTVDMQNYYADTRKKIQCMVKALEIMHRVVWLRKEKCYDPAKAKVKLSSVCAIKAYRGRVNASFTHSHPRHQM